MAAKIPYDGGLTLYFGVSNLDEAIAWYTGILGFALLYRKDEMGWCEMTCPVGNVQIGLSQVEKVEPRGGATPTFGTTDIDQAVAILRGQGVRFDGDVMRIPGMVALATMFDPDGNKIMLYQTLEGQGG